MKCTHGATVGRLDDVARFYVRSRGIPAEAADRLLTYAFAAEVVDEVTLAPVREELDRLVLRAARAASEADAMTATVPASARRSTSSGCAQDFPILAEQRARQAAGLSRQRRHQPEAPGASSTRSAASTRAENANIHRGVHYLSERATAGLRRRARAGGAIPQRGLAQRDRLHPRHDRGDQPRGPELGPAHRSRPATRS